MNRPKVSVAKKLFALSMNQCAFPDCDETLVDPDTRSLAARICHIKGNRPGSARYDKQQSDEERHGIDNLIVMCPRHSDIIDDKENLDQHTPEILYEMKAAHESSSSSDAVTSADELQECFAIESLHLLGDGVTSINQSGGQTANVINNFQIPSTDDVKSDLIARNIIDENRSDFGETRYSSQLGFMPVGGTLDKPPILIVLFAKLRGEAESVTDKESLLQWANPNELRYPPINAHPFLPTGFPEQKSKGILWHDGFEGVLNEKFCYGRYLAIESCGYFEYGFCPCYPWDEDGHGVYYAKCLASAFAFNSLDLNQAYSERCFCVRIKNLETLGVLMRPRDSKHIP